MEKYIIGSISSYTMKEEDLIPIFLDTLREFDEDRADEIQEDVDKLNLIESSDFGDYYDHEDDIDGMSSQELASYIINEDLFEALSEHCPPFFYFGSHPGDGADYGFWFDEDAMQDAIYEGEVKSFDDESPDFPVEDCDYVVVVNDHGNMTLYTFQGEEIWSIV